MGVDYVSFLTVKASNTDRVDSTAKDIEDLLRDRHDINKVGEEDFAVTTIKEARTAIQSGESPEVLLKTASKALAKGASKGLFHKKNASRRMSRLAKFANKQKAASKKI
jgi:ribosomal protein S20